MGRAPRHRAEQHGRQQKIPVNARQQGRHRSDKPINQLTLALVEWRPGGFGAHGIVGYLGPKAMGVAADGSLRASIQANSETPCRTMPFASMISAALPALLRT